MLRKATNCFVMLALQLEIGIPAAAIALCV